MPGASRGEQGGIDQRPRALRHRLGVLRADERRRLGVDHRAEVDGGVDRIAQAIRAGERRRAFDEGVVERFVDIDALDAAAGLPAVEERAVDQILDRVRQVGVGADIGGVLAAELEADADETVGRRLLHAAPPPKPSR